MSRSDFHPAERNVGRISMRELTTGVDHNYHHLRGAHEEIHHARTHGHGHPGYGHGHGHGHAHLHGHHDTAKHHLPSLTLDHHGKGNHGQSHGGHESHRSSTPPSKTGFSEALLHKLGAPVTKENLKFLDAWHRQEGGAVNNALNTSMRAPGAHSFNRDGVKVYPSMDVGVHATAATLKLPAYRGILSALHHGHSAHEAAVALGHSPWGTGKNVARWV